MDLDVITTILAVAKTKSFSTAAFMIPCAQSSVSRRVEAAENELNVRIFTRPSDSPDRSVRLTAAGERIIPILERIVTDYRELFSAAADTGKQQSVIRVGVRRNMLSPMAFGILKADFYELHPDISLELQVNSMDILLTELTARRLDAVWFSCLSMDSDSTLRQEAFTLRSLGKVGLSVGVSSQSPLAGRDIVSFRDLREETFLMNEAGAEQPLGIHFSDPGVFCRRVEEESNIKLNVINFSDHMLEMRYRLAQKNQGVFPSHTPACWRTLPGISYVQVSGAEHNAYYYLLSLKNNKELPIQTLAEFLSACIEKN